MWKFKESRCRGRQYAWFLLRTNSQRSYVQPITFQPSNITCGVRKQWTDLKLYLISGLMVWRLLKIIVYEVVRTSLQQRIRLTGLTCCTAFLYEMLYLIQRRRLNPSWKARRTVSCWEAFFPSSVEYGERSLWSWTWISSRKWNENQILKSNALPPA